MIYTMTLNPSLDYVVRVSDFTLGDLHRTEAEDILTGGKGINVARVLKQLGIDSRILGFTAGFTGREIEETLEHMGLLHDLVSVAKGYSRINIKLKSKNRIETEINGQGPAVESQDIIRLYMRLEAMQEGDILILSGSVPGQMPDREKAYANICEELKDKSVKLIVDAEGEFLRSTLRYKPFLIKPNLLELSKLLDKNLSTEEGIVEGAASLQREGAQNVLVSMAGEGALLITADGTVMRQEAPVGKVKNSVGAGDALLAGFLTSLLAYGKDSKLKNNYSKEEYAAALRFGVSTGSAKAFSEGFPEQKEIEQILASL